MLLPPAHGSVLAIAAVVAAVVAAAAGPEGTGPGPSAGVATRQATVSRASPSPGGQAETGTLLFFGNSLTAGYGLDPAAAFPALVQDEIDARGWPWRVVNAGVSGETSAGGARRIDWILRSEVDILVLELGGNDGLRGIPPDRTRANLQAIIDRTRERYPAARVVIAGMQMPPNLGQAYTEAFADLYPQLARENGAVLIPFLLEGVGGVADLNLRDGIHPNREGHRIVARTVWTVLEPLLRPTTDLARRRP